MNIYIETSVGTWDHYKYLRGLFDRTLQIGIDHGFVQLHVDTALPVQTDGCKHEMREIVVHESPQGWEQTWNHRKRMRAQLRDPDEEDHPDDFDLFIYQECDIGLESRHVSYFIEQTNSPKIQRPGYIIGFVLYESLSDGEKYLVGSPATGSEGNVAWEDPRDCEYISYKPDHQGFFMVWRDQLERAVEQGWGYELKNAPPDRPLSYGSLGATAATEIYICEAFRRVIPAAWIQDAMVEHLSGKYLEDHLGNGRIDQVRARDLTPGSDGRLYAYFDHSLERLPESALLAGS
jgi:hypothetical protein